MMHKPNFLNDVYVFFVIPVSVHNTEVLLAVQTKET